MNWNFENRLFLFISSDSCHKMMLLESLNIPLTTMPNKTDLQAGFGPYNQSIKLYFHIIQNTRNINIYKNQILHNLKKQGQIWRSNRYANKASKWLPLDIKYKEKFQNKNKQTQFSHRTKTSSENMPKINKPVTCNIKMEKRSILKCKDWYYSLVSINNDLKDFRKWLVEIAFWILSSIEFHVVGPVVLIVL